MTYRIDTSKLPNLNEVEQLFREHQKRYSEEKLHAKAKDDAGYGLPHLDAEEPSPFEKEILHASARLASMIASRFKGPLELLDAKIKAEREYVDRKYQNDLQRIENIYQTEKEAAEDAYGLKDAHRQLERCEGHYHKLYEKYGRGPIEYMPHWLYVIIATLIFLGEIPLNALVFQIFGENQVMTWVMAFVIGLCVPIAAHFVGIKAREHGDGLSVSNAIKAFVGIAIVGIALYGLSVMRQVYLGEFREALGLTERLVETSFLFFWLNMAVFAAAIMVAYLSHDPVPGYQRAEADCAAARKRVEKKEKTRVATLKAAAMKRAEELNAANVEHRDGVNRVNMMKGSYDQLLKEGQECESRCLDRLRQEISIYRHENLRHRQDKSFPRSFNVDMHFQLELEKMNEKINNEDSEKNHAHSQPSQA